MTGRYRSQILAEPKPVRHFAVPPDVKEGRRPQVTGAEYRKVTRVLNLIHERGAALPDEYMGEGVKHFRQRCGKG